MARRRMQTWSGRSRFECDGFVGQNLDLYYGSGFKHTLTVSALDVGRLLATFAGKDVPLGTNRTTPPSGSVGAWLQSNVTKTAIASYLGPILIADGRATRGSASDRIKFN